MTNRTIVLRLRQGVADEEPTHPDPVWPLLVSSVDAARVLGIGRTTLYELVKSGDLTPIHLRRCVRFSMREIEHLSSHSHRTGE